MGKRDDCARGYAEGFAQVASGMGTAEAATAPTSAVIRLPAAQYQAPVAGVTVRGGHFGDVRSNGEIHHGLDIAAPVGSAIHPIAGGEVISVSQDSKSGKFIRVRHPDGTVSSYSHLGNQGVKVGDPVTAETAIGTVGMTGHTTGPHLHLRVKDAQGKDIDPSRVIGTRAAGGVVTTAQGPRNWDQGSVLAAISKRTDWSPEKREGVTAYARQHMAQDEAALSDAYGDAADDAARVIVNLPGGLTSMSQIPASIRARLKPTMIESLTNDARAAATRAAAFPENSARSMELQILQRADPTAFAHLKLADDVGKVSPSELRSFVLAQATIVGNASKPPQAFAPRQGINAAIAWGGRYGGVKVADKDFPRVFDTMEAYLHPIFVAKQKLDPADYDAAFQAAMHTVPTHSTFMGIPMGQSSIPAYTATADTMGAGVREQIIRNWQGPKPPTEADIMSVYRGRVAASGGH